MEQIDRVTLWNMEDKGNLFERRIASACYVASDEQLAEIIDALPEVFEKYRPPGIPTPPSVALKPRLEPMVQWTPCPGCKRICNIDGKCVNTGCVFGPDDDGTTPPMVEPPHGHDFSYPVEKVTP